MTSHNPSYLPTDNTTEALQAASVTTTPGLWMATYDPTYDIKQMVSYSQLYTTQIDANSHTVVKIGLVHYRYLNKTSNYKYRKYNPPAMALCCTSTDGNLKKFLPWHAKIWTCM
jgi:hypothetical protein